MQYKVFGCKVNKYYTDAWLNSDYLRDKDGVFVASCVVTDSAKRKWIRFVKKELQNISPEEKIYISGCGAFKDGKAQDNFFELYPELASSQISIEILDEKPDLPADISLKEEKKKEAAEKIPLGLAKLSKLEKLKNSQIYTKKFILIQGGCDSYCTFCLTVQKRGKHYYRSAEDIASEINDFESSGGKEVVLTGVNLSSWGLKNTYKIENFSPEIIKNGETGGGSRFAELLEYLLANTSIPRLRISSLGPEFIDDRVLEICRNSRIYPHFHYSIQSGSSKILAKMARHYDGEYMRKLLKKTHDIPREDSVDISIGADIIVGFPGESEEDFMDTYNLVKDYNITKLHAFPFSPHQMGESVPAGGFEDQIPEKIKKDRMSRLLALGVSNREKFYTSQKGKTLEVLIEKHSGESWSGWTQNYLEANQDNFVITAGEIKKNSIVSGYLK